MRLWMRGGGGDMAMGFEALRIMIDGGNGLDSRS